MRLARSLVFGALLALSGPASAQEATPSEAEVEPPGADAYTQRVQQGIAALVGGDSAGAMAPFREAMGMDGNRPQAIYYLAAANRMTGNYQDALTGFERAGDVAENDPRWRGRAMQAVADTLERMEGRLEEARNAWQAYVSFADQNQAVTYPQLGRARIQAIDVMLEQERAYTAVRQRIAEREAEAAQPQPRARRRGRR